MSKALKKHRLDQVEWEKKAQFGAALMIEASFTTLIHPINQVPWGLRPLGAKAMVN